MHFEGITEKKLLKFWKTLLTFVQKVFPNGCRFMQDNDPKQF